MEKRFLLNFLQDPEGPSGFHGSFRVEVFAGGVGGWVGGWVMGRSATGSTGVPGLTVEVNHEM